MIVLNDFFWFSAFQKVHCVFRGYWHFYKQSTSQQQTEFKVYKSLSNLEETGPKEKVIRFDDVLFHLPSLTQSVALLTDFANNRITFFDDQGNGNFDEVGALRGLFFPMSGCDVF